MKQLMIAHRGNLTGPNPDEENKPDYILKAIDKGFDVEIDFRYIDNHWYLGHDYAQYKTSWKFILEIKDYLWAHAKNTEALILLTEANINCFWHENDERTLTFHGYIWTYPGKEILKEKIGLEVGIKTIAVMPETVKDWDISGAHGICSDYMSV